jgi:hypothetical protein
VGDFATQAALVSALGLVAVLPRTALPETEAVVALPLLPDLLRRLMIVARTGTARHAFASDLIAALREVAAARAE